MCLNQPCVSSKVMSYKKSQITDEVIICIEKQYDCTFLKRIPIHF